LWVVRNKTVRRESRVGLSHGGQYSARGSRPDLTYGIRAEDDSFLRWGIVTSHIERKVSRDRAY